MSAKACALLAALCGAAAAWIFASAREPGSLPGTAVLGLYRDRWFLLGVAAGWLAGVFGLWTAFGRRPGFAPRLILLHVGLGLALGMLELASIAGLVDYPVLFRLRAPSDPAAHAHGLSRMGMPHAHYEGRARPDLVEILGVEAESIPYTVDTDRYGLRNRDSDEPPRVVCLGDSVLVGGLLAADELLTERLARALGVRVLSVAEVGYAPQESLRRFETTGISPQGKLFLHLVFEGNDLTDSARWRARDEAFSRGGWPWTGFVKSALARLHQPRRGAALRRAGLCRTREGEQSVYFLYDGAQLAQALPELSRLAPELIAARDDLEARGGRYALVLVPSKLSALAPACRWPADSELAAPATRADSELPARLAALADEHGIPFLDLTPALREAALEGALPFFAADTHPNAHGHAVMAEALAKFAEPLLRP
jgi:hypothetical protein